MPILVDALLASDDDVATLDLVLVQDSGWCFALVVNPYNTPSLGKISGRRLPSTRYATEQEESTGYLFVML